MSAGLLVLYRSYWAVDHVIEAAEIATVEFIGVVGEL